MGAHGGLRHSRVRLGAMILPLARRRPWKVARKAVTLDHPSNGGLVLPVGLGALDDSGWGRVSEPTDRRTRAERMDETLQILTGLWTGKPFGYQGRHYRFEPMAFTPSPIQRPRIPIWVVGGWPSERSITRALRYDGLLPYVLPRSGVEYGPEAVAELRKLGRSAAQPGGVRHRGRGTTSVDNPDSAAEVVRPWQEAGATWWIESDCNGGMASTRRRVEAGPPTLRSG